MALALRIRASQSGSPREGGEDPAIDELELDALDLSLIGLDVAFGLDHRRGLCVELLLSDEAARHQPLVALEIEAGVGEGGLITSELPLRLCQLRLEGARVYLREQVSCPDDLSLAEEDAHELAIHAAPDRDGVEGGYRAQRRQVHAQVAGLGGCRQNRHGSGCRPRARAAGGGLRPARPVQREVGASRQQERDNETGGPGPPRPRARRATWGISYLLGSGSLDRHRGSVARL